MEKDREDQGPKNTVVGDRRAETGTGKGITMDKHEAPISGRICSGLSNREK